MHYDELKTLFMYKKMRMEIRGQLIVLSKYRTNVEGCWERKMKIGEVKKGEREGKVKGCFGKGRLYFMVFSYLVVVQLISGCPNLFLIFAIGNAI